MTRDDIIKALDWCPVRHAGPQSLLVRIERVVAQAEAQEREACARVCEQAARGYEERGMDMAYAASEWIEAAIRARNQA